MQADRLLRRGDDGRVGRVGDDDPAPGGRVDVDVVDPDPGAADHLQAVGLLDQLGGQLRRRADDDRVVVADRRCEVRVAVDVDVEVLAQELDPRLGDRLPDEDSRLHAATGAAYASSAAVVAAPRSMSAPCSASASSTAASAVVMSKTS